MNILILTNKMPYPPRDGGSIATLSLIMALADRVSNVEVLAMNTSKHYVDIEQVPQNILQKLKLTSSDIDTTISPIALLKNYFFSKIPYNAERFINSDFRNKLIDILKQNTFDIIQLEGLYLCPYIPYIREYSKALISLRAHNIEHEIWERTVINESSLLKKIYLKKLAHRIKRFEHFYLNQYDLLVPITNRDARKFTKMGNNKPVQVIPTGIDATRYLVKENNKWPGLFHIGALDWIPNQEGLLWFIKNSWPELKKKHPNLEFTIAGRNAPDAFVKKIKQDGIKFVGEVEDSIEFMNHHSVMLVPLLSGSGMRIKIVEGMALGKAIVTTPVGTEGIDSTHNKNIFISNTIEGFTHEVDKIITNHNLYMNISKNAIKFAQEQFENKAIASKLTSFYEEHLA